MKLFVSAKVGEMGVANIGAAMYSLEALLNCSGENSVTSGPCLWMGKPQSNTEPCNVKKSELVKIKPPASKKKKVHLAPKY